MDKPSIYRIKVRGGLTEAWIDRLGGLRISAETSEEVTLEGWLPDQAALAGVLDTLFTLHLPILEVTRLTEQSAGYKNGLHQGTGTMKSFFKKGDQNGKQRTKKQ